MTAGEDMIKDVGGYLFAAAEPASPSDYSSLGYAGMRSAAHTDEIKYGAERER